MIEAEQAFQNTTIISNETARQILIEEIKDRILYYIIGYAWAGLGQTVLILIFALLNAYSNLRASNVSFLFPYIYIIIVGLLISLSRCCHDILSQIYLVNAYFTL